LFLTPGYCDIKKEWQCLFMASENGQKNTKLGCRDRGPALISELPEDVQALAVIALRFGEAALLVRHSAKLMVANCNVMLVASFLVVMKGSAVVGFGFGEPLLFMGENPECVMGMRDAELVAKF
jgi:hypothetical protein